MVTYSQRWASSGAMALTGDADGPPLVPSTTAAEMVDNALRPFGLDSGVLGERAALLGLTRTGARSCGGASRLLRALDGWVVITLARESDVADLPAVFEVDPAHFQRSGVGDAAPWLEVEDLVRCRPAEEVVSRSRLLGLPVGMVGEGSHPFRSERRDEGAERSVPAPLPRVVDLSALWAGPLATSCLHRAGAEIIKIEDRRRPDGARRGNKAFFDLLNAGKLSVSLDFTDPTDLVGLKRLVLSADIVVTAARSGALNRLGLDPEPFLAAGKDRVWVAITAHGWSDDRVGFGDDIAATAGLVAWHSDGAPRFAADAIADPLGGALAAEAAQQAWETGGRWFIDASLGGAVTASLPSRESSYRKARAADARGAQWSLDGQLVATPSGRMPLADSAPLGADTEAVLAGLT